MNNIIASLKSLENQPGKPDVNINSGAIHNEFANLDQVLAFTLKSLESNPNNPTALINLGSIYKNLGNLDQALASTLKSLEINPDNSDALLNLGSIHQGLGNFDQALASTLKSLEINPDNSVALFNLGIIYKDLGNLDQALAATLKSLESNPDNSVALLNLGNIYKDLGNLDQALTSTFKSLELKPDNPTAHMNLGSIYKDLGNLDQALTSTLKSLELKPDNPTAHMNLGSIYQDLGNLDRAIDCLKEAAKCDIINGTAMTRLAKIYYYTGKYRDGINAIRGAKSVEAENTRLSLYLCLNNKIEFNKCANYLIKRCMLNQQGVAAIDHANVLFSQQLDNGLGGNTLDSVFIQTIRNHEDSNTLIQDLLIELSSGLMQSRVQEHLDNGLQTSGNILDLPGKPFQSLKKLLLEKISEYNNSCDINTDKNFEANWERNLYSLKGWAIIMNKGGSLRSHNHENGWLTGTLYLQMPEEGSNPQEGAIEFSHQGPKYPEGNATFEKRLIRPSAGDLNIFSSSLFHRTLPFQSAKKRICIAFDVIRLSKY